MKIVFAWNFFRDFRCIQQKNLRLFYALLPNEQCGSKSLLLVMISNIFV